MADIPRSIRVSYRDYTVEDWSAQLASAANRVGECDNQNGIIRIRMDLDPKELANTLIHELMHACFFCGAIEDDHKEEQTVTVLTNQLAQVWRDNPKLITWLNEQLT